MSNSFSIVESLDDLIEVILFITTLMYTIVLAFNLFVIDMNDTLRLDTLVSFFNLCGVLGVLFMFCYLSEWITADLLEIGEIFYNSAWYQLAPHQQKLLTLPIQRAHREFRLKCQGLFDCSLPVFLSVILVRQIQTNKSYFTWNDSFFFRLFERPPLTLLLCENFNNFTDLVTFAHKILKMSIPL